VILHVKPYLVAAPSEVAKALVTNWPLLIKNVWPTAIESLAGFALGNLFAIALAIIFVHSKTLEQTFYPMAVVLRTIPIVALAPILVLLLGQGYAPKIGIAALISFFPTLVNMVRGFGAVDPQMLELMRVLSANRREVFFKLRPDQFAAVSVRRPQDRHRRLRDRRHRRRVDRFGRRPRGAGDQRHQPVRNPPPLRHHGRPPRRWR